MKKIFSRLMLVVMVFYPLVRVTASEITLKNGDRVSGTIVEQSDETVILETEYAGKITIAKKHIEKIAETASRGELKDQMVKVVAAVPPAKPAAKAPAPAPKQAQRLFGGRFMGLADGWDGNANIGFSYTSGNSNNTTMTTGLRAVKSGVTDNLTVYVRSLWNSTHGTGRMVTTQNAFWGGARYDRNINRKAFGFVSYDFERDRPKNLNFRSVVGGGFGHHTIKKERTELDILAGAAWNRTWQPGKNSDTPEALAGTTLKHKFHDRLRLQKTFTYFQNVTDAKEYRFLFDATVSADVTKRIGFFVAIGDRFNNDPIGTSKKNDFLFTTGMKWNFGKKR